MAYFRSEHENKFDRQMRLWGGHGQARIERAHLVLLGSTATATECLKNLVLPNLGHFTIVDDAVVDANDVGSNFFVDETCVGQSRARAVCDRMLEMNQDVKGDVIVESPVRMIEDKLDSFATYSMVVATQIPQPALLRLSSFLYERNIPLVVLHSYGMIGYARLQVAELPIIESHPTNDRSDLYVHPAQLQHWPELQRYVYAFPLLDTPAVEEEEEEEAAAAAQPASSATAATVIPEVPHDRPLDTEERAHVPYIAILAQHMRLWLRTHEHPPRTWDEKQAFKQQISSTAGAQDTNFSEAVEFAHRVYDMPRLDRMTQSVLDDAASNVDALRARYQRESPSTPSDGFFFWLFVAALKRFIANEGHGTLLPVSEDIPDMHSKTAWYVHLKQIFRDRARRDRESISEHVRAILREIGAEATVSLVDGTQLELFIKHVRDLRIVRTRSIAQEYGPHKSAEEEDAVPLVRTLNELFEEETFLEIDEEAAANENEPAIPSPKLVHWYLGFRFVQQFHARHGRYPGVYAPEEQDQWLAELDGGSDTPWKAAELRWQADVPELVSIARAFFTQYQLDSVGAPDEAVLLELCRFAACQPHTVAAFMGGIGSQMALKVMLHQYVPVNHTYVFNGVHCSSATFQL